MRVRWIAVALAAAFAHAAFAQLTASVSATTVVPGEIFTLTIAAEGGRATAPVLPSSADIIFMNANNPSVSNQSSMSFVNGQVRQSRSISWTYKLRIDKEGTFTLPPITVKIDAKDFNTEPLTITVSKNAPRRTARPRPSVFGGMVDPFQAAPPVQRGTVDDQVPFDDLVVLEVKADKTEAYAGEPITITFTYGQLDAPGLMLRGQEPQAPHVQGFFVRAGEEPTRTVETRNGRRYVLAPRKQLWFATSPGEYTIPEFEWPVGVSRPTPMGYDNRSIVKRAPAITLKIKPLPAAPAGFSGAVGEIGVTASLPQGELLQGSPVTFTVSVTGKSNPASISAPEIPALDWAHLSPPTASQDDENDGDPNTLKTFTYTLTPLSEGPHEIPELSILYFSPEADKFQPAVAPKIPVTVRKAVTSGPMVVVGGPQPGASASGTRVIAGLHPPLDAAAPVGPARSGRALNGVALVVPPVAYTGLLLFIRRQRRLREDTTYARDYFARSKSMKRLARVRSAAEPGEELFRALAGFVADKLHVEEAGMTSADARDAIVRHGLPATLAENVQKILRACERARYAGAALSEAELNALIDAAAQSMDTLEAALKPGGRP